MNREVHVRFWESPEVKVLRATRQPPNFVVRHLRMPIALLGIGLVTGLGAASLLGQTQQVPGGQSASAGAGADPDARVPYPVGMGEIMAFGVQPRHLTLAAAVRAGDWAYAAYALKELGETFGRIPRAIPNYQGRKSVKAMGVTTPFLEGSTRPAPG
jgi:hypothetical protein